MVKINYQKIMKLAVKLAKQADPHPNPKVGAVLIKNNQIIGCGYHHEPGKPHAEIEAINDAKKRGNENQINGSILVVSLEPCVHTNKRTAPCTKAILKEGIGTVVFGMNDPNPSVNRNGEETLRAAGLKVIGPVSEKECRGINQKYISNITKKPLVILKMAASIDGKIATKTGDSKWITNEKSREYVHKMRSEVDAIIVGSGTVIADNPQLTARIKNGKNPYRIIIDSKLKIPPSSNVIKNPDGKTIVITTENAQKKNAAKIKNTRILTCGKEKVDLPKTIDMLSALGMKKIIIEGGSELAGASIEAGIVDKIYLFIAPIVIGGKDSKSIIGANGIEKIAQAHKTSKIKVKRIGNDLLLIADIVKKNEAKNKQKH